MKKNLFSIGNGWALYLSSSLIKLIGVDPKLSHILFTLENKELEVKEVDISDFKNPDKFLIRKLTKSGNGFALYIPNSILELLEINPEIDQVELNVDKNILKLKKAL